MNLRHYGVGVGFVMLCVMSAGCNGVEETEPDNVQVAFCERESDFRRACTGEFLCDEETESVLCVFDREVHQDLDSECPNEQFGVNVSECWAGMKVCIEGTFRTQDGDVLTGERKLLEERGYKERDFSNRCDDCFCSHGSEFCVEHECPLDE